MEQRVSLITLGVADVHRARMFYQRLGWEGQEVEETVFHPGRWYRGGPLECDKLALDCGIADHQAAGFRGVVLDHNVRSEAEVDVVMAAAEGAGATITRPPAKTFYGGFRGLLRRSRRPRLGDRAEPGHSTGSGRLDPNPRLGREPGEPLVQAAVVAAQNQRGRCGPRRPQDAGDPAEGEVAFEEAVVEALFGSESHCRAFREGS